MLSLLALLVVAQEEPTSTPVMSEVTRTCIDEFAPQIEQSFESLLSGAEFIVGFVCSDQIRADVVAFASNYPMPDWSDFLSSGGNDTHYVVADPTVGQHGQPTGGSQESGSESGGYGEVFGVSEAYRELWANYTPPPRIQVVQHNERPAEIMDYIGRTLLELRINRIEMERQEDN
jgi:hypothetical protein